MRQIQLVIEECALGKFTGPRRTRPEVQTTPKDHLHHNGAAVAMQLQRIFARVRRRADKMDGQPFIKRVPGRIKKRQKRRSTRLQSPPKDPCNETGNIPARDPHNTDSALTGSGGDRRYDIGFRHSGILPASHGYRFGTTAFGGSNMRLICHC